MDILMLALLIIIILLFIFLSWVWPPDSPWAPWWRTKKNTAKAAFRLAKLNKEDIVYELGSGEATALIVAVNDFDAKGVGIEIEPARYFLSKFMVWRKGFGNHIILKRSNMFQEDLSNATVVYIYLVPKTLNKLIPKFKKELKKGTRIVSYKYEMDLPLKKYDKKNELRLYLI